MKIMSQHTCFAGMQNIYSHLSATLNCEMRFAIFLPPQSLHKKIPVLYWLSGLTCTEENFITKAGAQRMAAQLGIAIVVPDTSPRGEEIPDESDRYDFGKGAGFYLDATQQPWLQNYKMYSYITDELFALINENFPVDSDKTGIFGHSMGGHGALTIALKNPNQYKSVSAFAPISSPVNCAWGQYAFTQYLGANIESWQNYDATYLIKEKGWFGRTILVDQGGEDLFLETQLKPQLLREACLDADVTLNLRLQTGYDHSYFFIATFMEDHLRFHYKNLSQV